MMMKKKKNQGGLDFYFLWWFKAQWGKNREEKGKRRGENLGGCSMEQRKNPEENIHQPEHSNKRKNYPCGERLKWWKKGHLTKKRRGLEPRDNGRGRET